MPTKTELMGMIRAGLGAEVFEHSEEGFFDVTSTRAMLQDTGDKYIVKVALDQILPAILKWRVWEEERVNSLTEREYLLNPGILVETPSGHHVMIDGTHRAIRLGREGYKDMLFHLIPISMAIRPPACFTPAQLRGEESGTDWGAHIDSLPVPTPEEIDALNAHNKALGAGITGPGANPSNLDHSAKPDRESIIGKIARMPPGLTVMEFNSVEEVQAFLRSLE